MFNLVVLTGRLTADPELKHTQSDIPVTSFSIAVNRRYKAGEECQADFINIVAWRSTAEFITKYFKKGSMIGVEGSIQTRKYEEKDSGKTRTVFEVVANNVQFVDSKKGAGEPSPAAPATNPVEPPSKTPDQSGDAAAAVFYQQQFGDDDLSF